MGPIAAFGSSTLRPVHSKLLATPQLTVPLSRFNDGTTDYTGRIWPGTMKDGGKLVAFRGSLSP